MKAVWNENKGAYVADNMVVDFVLSGYAIVRETGMLYKREEVSFREFELIPFVQMDMWEEMLKRANITYLAHNHMFYDEWEEVEQELEDMAHNTCNHYATDIETDINIIERMARCANVDTIVYPLGFRECGVDSVSFMENRTAKDYICCVVVEYNVANRTAKVYMAKKA